MLLLLLSGDIETNPGPIGESDHNAYQIMEHIHLLYRVTQFNRLSFEPRCTWFISQKPPGMLKVS